MHPQKPDVITAGNRFPYPSSFYMDAYRSYQSAAGTLRSQTRANGKEVAGVGDRLFEQRARAKWALVCRGIESVPYAVQMLRSSDPEEREDGRVILELIGGDDEVVRSLATLLDETTDADLAGNVVSLLGELKNAGAVPRLTAIVLDSASDVAVKQAAMRSLGILAQSRQSERAASEV
jgi:hypothetical protein